MKLKNLNTATNSNTSTWRKLAKSYSSVGLLAALVAACGTGIIRHRMDVTRDDGYREILYKGISANRPYIHWCAAEYKLSI